jgi:EAL domain-containing protein (putative c-di-GMP-specific phosphodiesterase class I)/FixJ family two-component response regulator
VAAATSPTIVVIDDEPINVTLLQRIIEQAGIGRAMGYTDAREGVAAIAANEPDLILLDVHMPFLDGFGALDAIHAGLPTDSFVPVLFLTADVDRDVRTRALEAGAKDFLTKPFDMDEVVLRCRNLLETRRLHVELRRHNAALRLEVHERTTALDAANRDRLAVATALGRPRPVDTAEEAAQLLCHEIVGYDELVGAAILVFGTGRRAAPMAVEGFVGLPLHAGRDLPAERAAGLRDRAANGPWTEDLASPSHAERGASGGPRARILAPLHSGRELVGVLAVATTGALDGQRLASLLPTVVEYAALAGAIMGPELLARQRDVDLRRTMEAIIGRRAFSPVFQPIVELDGGRVLGHEALTRFEDGERPERRFADAEAVGLGVELELICLNAALAAAPDLASGDWLSLNVSPGLVLAPGKLRTVLRTATMPVVLEITEHVPVTDYRAFRQAIDSIGPTVRFAVDDAGAGFSSFRHIVELAPDFVKLDIGLVRGVDQDTARQALVAGMDFFAMRTGCTLIAEGIETEAERDTLQSLSVQLGQGFLLGRPAAAAS